MILFTTPLAPSCHGVKSRNQTIAFQMNDVYLTAPKKALRLNTEGLIDSTSLPYMPFTLLATCLHSAGSIARHAATPNTVPSFLLDLPHVHMLKRYKNSVRGRGTHMAPGLTRTHLGLQDR